MLSLAIEEVLALKEKHSQTWRDKSESYWFAALAEEFGELGAALNGEHKDPPECELKQIAAICLNWLEFRLTRGDYVINESGN